jgi:apyrase
LHLQDTINYLSGNIGSDYEKTVAVLNQDSASMEVAYAISSKAAANAPSFPHGEEYISTHHIQSSHYYLYSHGFASNHYPLKKILPFFL